MTRSAVDVPAWLREALAICPPWAPEDATVDTGVGPPKPGELRMTSATTAPQRLVLILHVDLDVGVALVALTHNEPEFATDGDLSLPPLLSGVPFSLCVEADVVGTIPVDHLRSVITSVPTGVLEAVRDLGDGHCPRELQGFRGLPIFPHEDHRRRFKEQEAEVLERLATAVSPGPAIAVFNTKRTSKASEERRAALVEDGDAAVGRLFSWRADEAVRVVGELATVTATPAGRGVEEGGSETVDLSFTVSPNQGSPDQVAGVGVHLAQLKDVTEIRHSGRLNEHGQALIRGVDAAGAYKLTLGQRGQHRTSRPLRDLERIAASSEGPMPSIVLLDATGDVRATIGEAENGHVEAIVESKCEGPPTCWVELPLASPSSDQDIQLDRLFVPLRWSEARRSSRAHLYLGLGIEIADRDGLWLIDLDAVAEAPPSIVTASVERSDNWTKETWRDVLRQDLPEALRLTVRHALSM